jgi:hypothetical protein
MPNVLETRAVFGDLAHRGAIAQFADVFDQSLQVYDGTDVLSKIFKVESTSDSIIRDTSLAGLGLFAETNEGDAYDTDSNLVGYETTYFIKDLTKSVEVTKNRLDDTNYKTELDAFRLAGISARMTKGKYTLNVLNSAFSTSVTNNGFTIYRMGDAKALASVSHPRKDGGTAQSNASATGITLTELNLETGRLALVKQLTDRGLPIEFMGKLVLAVPDDLEKDATIFANTEFRPTTANNDINFYNGRIGVLASRWLNSAHGGSSTAWHLIDTNVSKLKLYVRQEPQFFTSIDGKTQNRIFAIQMRMAAGHSDWKGTWHSKGDGAAYAS